MTRFNVGDNVIAVRDTVLLDRGEHYRIADVFEGRAYVVTPENQLVSYADDYFMPATKLLGGHFPPQAAPEKPVAPTVAADLRITPKARVILRHLKAGKPISPAEAMVVYSQSRLAAAIYEIRQAGYKVTTERCKDESGHGYSRYSLIS